MLDRPEPSSVRPSLIWVSLVERSTLAARGGVVVAMGLEWLLPALFMRHEPGLGRLGVHRISLRAGDVAHVWRERPGGVGRQRYQRLPAAERARAKRPREARRAAGRQ